MYCGADGEEEVYLHVEEDIFPGGFLPVSRFDEVLRQRRGVPIFTKHGRHASFLLLELHEPYGKRSREQEQEQAPPPPREKKKAKRITKKKFQEAFAAMLSQGAKRWMQSDHASSYNPGLFLEMQARMRTVEECLQDAQRCWEAVETVDTFCLANELSMLSTLLLLK